MPNSHQSNHLPDFKSNVVIELLSNKIPIQDLCRNYKISEAHIDSWKNEFLHKADELLFDQKRKVIDAYINWTKTKINAFDPLHLARKCVEHITIARIIDCLKVTEFSKFDFNRYQDQGIFTDRYHNRFVLKAYVDIVRHYNLLSLNAICNIDQIRNKGNFSVHDDEAYRSEIEDYHNKLTSIVDEFFVIYKITEWKEKYVTPQLRGMYSDLAVNLCDELKPLLSDNEKAERHWQYIQNHPITSFEVSFFLKTSVGYKWLLDLFDRIRISFSRTDSSLKLSQVLKNSPDPNKKEDNRKNDMPVCCFWELYELEEGYWCKRINTKGRSFNLVAGFDASIPWNFFNIPNIIILKDLSKCNEIGISFPPQIFQAGIEEVIFCVNGETFSFSVYLSEETLLDSYQEMTSALYSLDRNESVPLSFILSLPGVKLLDIFHKQNMPGYKHSRKNEGIILGQSGPNGNAISFYPSKPKGFNKTEESKEFIFTIPAQNEIDYGQIEKELKMQIEINKNNINDYTQLASLYVIQGRFQEILKLLKSAINLLEPNSLFYCIIGSAYANLGRYFDALGEFKKAEIMEPNNSIIQESIGTCLEELEQYEIAIEYFKKAAINDTLNAAYQYKVGKNLCLLHRDSEAIIYMRNAVNLKPDDIDYNITLGIILAADNKIDEAFHSFQKAITINPRSAEANKYFAKILAKKGEHIESIKYFKFAIELTKDIECYAGLSGLLINANQFLEAEPIILDGLKIDQNNYDLLICYGLLKVYQEKIEEAIELFEKADTLSNEDNKAKVLIEQLKNSH